MEYRKMIKTRYSHKSVACTKDFSNSFSEIIKQFRRKKIQKNVENHGYLKVHPFRTRHLKTYKMKLSSVLLCSNNIKMKEQAPLSLVFLAKLMNNLYLAHLDHTNFPLWREESLLQ